MNMLHDLHHYSDDEQARKKNMVPFVPQLPVYWLKGQKWISLKDAHSVSSTQPVNETNVLSKLGVFATMFIVLGSTSDGEIFLSYLWITSVHKYDDLWSEQE